MIKLDLITAAEYYNDYKKEVGTPTTDKEKEINIGIGRADEYLVASTKTVAVLEENTGDDGELTDEYKASLEYSILQTATAQLTELFINNDHDFTQGSFSSSINGVSSSHQRGEFVVPDQTLALLIRAGVLDSVIVDQTDDCPVVGDIPGQSREDEYLTQADGNVLYVKSLNSTNMSLTGGKDVYDMDALVNANDTENVRHLPEDGSAYITSQLQHWNNVRDIAAVNEKADNNADYQIGLNAEADVLNTAVQALPINDTIVLEFDTAVRGTAIDPDTPGSTGNVDLTANTITVENYDDKTELQFTLNLTALGDNNGSKDLTFRVEHLSADGIPKDFYVFRKVLQWDTLNTPYQDFLKADVSTPSPFTGASTHAAIVPGDKFQATAVVPDNGQPKMIKLNHFALADTSKLIGASTAQQVAFDSSNLQGLDVQTVQALGEALYKGDLVVDGTSLTTNGNPAGQQIHNYFNSKVGQDENQESYTMILDITEGDNIGKWYAKVRNYTPTSMQLEGFIYSPNATPDAPGAFVRSSISSADTAPIQIRLSQMKVETGTQDSSAVNKGQMDAAIAAIPTPPAGAEFETVSVLISSLPNGVDGLAELMNSGNCFNLRLSAISNKQSASYIVSARLGIYAYHWSGTGLSLSNNMNSMVIYERIKQ